MNKTASPSNTYKLTPQTFENLYKVLLEFSKPDFANLSEQTKFHRINQLLLKLLQKTYEESFLLSAVIDYIEQVNQKKLLQQTYNFSSFEFWLNHSSNISVEDNYAIRAKIAGKYLPREDYQSLFPIGMDKTFDGTHFVVAHLSPDVDTMVASFFGWLDAFAARVGTARHIWSLPGGPPEGPFTNIFRSSLGSSIFTHLANTASNLALTAADLVKTKNEAVDINFNENESILIDEEIHDIKIKMAQREYLTVVIQDSHKKLSPIGIIWAKELNKSILGTVSFRDFCNFDEVRMASYLSPISVIDHHKVALHTNSPPLALISDAQSCNVLVAEQAFLLNDRYSAIGMTASEIEAQIEQLQAAPISSTNTRILRRLLQRREAAQSQFSENYFVHPLREQTEYFCFLHAILDDTDLLSKVGKRDVQCVVELLNRINSIIAKKEMEVVNLDKIPQGKNFAKEAAKRILHTPEMYSFYRQIYDSKELEIEEILTSGQANKLDFLFIDTKEQNGCCRVGQTKFFSSNFPSFAKKSPVMMEHWLKNAQSIHNKKNQVDLHLHMISTVASAAEVYEEKIDDYNHQDQLWFWVPATQKGYDHLASFLTAFFGAVKFDTETHIQFFPGVSEEIQQIFMRNRSDIGFEKLSEGMNLPIVVLYFTPGTINSRKAMITPYLPKL